MHSPGALVVFLLGSTDKPVRGSSTKTRGIARGSPQNDSPGVVSRRQLGAETLCEPGFGYNFYTERTPQLSRGTTCSCVWTHCCCPAPRGMYSLGERIMYCPGGTYQDMFGQCGCKPCPNSVLYKPGKVDVMGKRLPNEYGWSFTTRESCAIAICGEEELANDVCLNSTTIIDELQKSVQSESFCSTKLAWGNDEPHDSSCRFCMSGGLVDNAGASFGLKTRGAYKSSLFIFLLLSLFLLRGLST